MHVEASSCTSFLRLSFRLGKDREPFPEKVGRSFADKNLQMTTVGSVARIYFLTGLVIVASLVAVRTTLLYILRRLNSTKNTLPDMMCV